MVDILGHGPSKFTIDVIIQFAGKMTDYIGALVDCMVTHYREKYERLERLMIALQENYRGLREDYHHLKANYERLENWANDQEQRADALHDVIDRYINRSGPGIRRDLLDAFNEVANELDIDIDEIVNTSDVESDFSLGFMSD